MIEVTARVSNVTIRNGNGVGLDSGAGGGIFIHSGALLLQNSTVSGNNATMGGGIAAAATAQLIGVTVSGNRPSTGRLTRGGGIIISSTGSLLLGNATVSGNTAVDETGAASQGGGVHSSGTLVIIASTISANSAGEGGGLYSVAPATGAATSLQNSLISHGTGGACGGPGLDNLTATANVISDATCQFKDPSNLQSVNPQIGALADNGGPTNTHALQPTSPAIHHAGSCATTDQRGFTRVTPCDSGAYEYRAPTLNVVMQVVNDSGGNFNPSRFTVHVRSAAGGDVSGSPQPGSASGTGYTLAAGSTYAVAADALAGYTLSVSGDCTAGGSITLQEGQARTCTITADDIAPTLRVITNVVNNEGGTLGPAGFTAHVRTGGFDVANSPQAGSATGTVYTLSAGPTYTVSADAAAGYSLGITGTCATNGNITLALGQNATCTIMATDNPPTLRVFTTVVNDNGGTLAPGNFLAHIRAGGTDVNGSPQTGTSTGTLYTLSAGVNYTISADAVANYSLSVSGDCAANGTITLQLDQDRSCTITANDIGPTLRVVTNVVNDNGGTRAAADFTVHVRQGANDVATSPQPGVGAPGTLYTLSAGSYTVSADAFTGYTFAITGDCAANGTITLSLGQARSCTITANDVAPTLRVITTVVNNSGGTAVAANFSAHVRQNGTEVTGSPQAGVGAPGTLYTLSAGTYAVTADGVSGYTPTGSGACNASGAVTLTPGQNLTCTITVDDVAPTLRVITTVLNNSGGTAVAGSFSAHVRQNGTEVTGSPQAGVGAPGTLYTLSAGAYAVTADGVSGYTPTGSGACSAAGAVTLTPGQNLTCTITVDDVAPTSARYHDGREQQRRDGGRRRASRPMCGRTAPRSAAVRRRASAHRGRSTRCRRGPTRSPPTVSRATLPTGSGACNAAGTVTLTVGQNLTCTITVDDVAPTAAA